MKKLTILICATLISITSTMAQNIDIDAINFPDANFRAYLLSRPFGSDSVLTPAEIAGITHIGVPNLNISDLTGIGFFTALTNLGCDFCQLTSLDLSANTALRALECHGNQLTSLNVSGCTALEFLWCTGNQLTSLDVSSCTALEDMDCGYNQLTSLDVSGCTALKHLYCYTNQLTSLDISTNTNLIDLICYENQLTSLDVSNHTALTNLQCHNNQLSTLDLSNNTALQYLQCYNNQLTSLDVSNNTALEYLDCSNNQLTSIDVSNNTALEWLFCYENQLPLSELYPASTMVATQDNKELGFQQLSPVAATVGTVVNWSPLPAQNVFNGIYTTYDVRTGSSHTGPVASTSDYTVSNGNITFNTTGTYTVIMKNAAITCNASPELQVVSTITASAGAPCEPVSGITNIPSCTPVGNMELNGTVAPSNATQQDIVWSVLSAGTTGATISDTTLITTAVGTATVRATISNGLCGSNYTQDFNITVIEAVTDINYTPGTISRGNPLTLGYGLTLTPGTVTDYSITWSVVNASTTGAGITGNVLKVTSFGTLTVRAHVINNTCGNVIFTKDYPITVNGGCCY